MTKIPKVLVFSGLLLAMVLVFALATQAQDNLTIAYGDTASGSLTTDHPAVTYNFNGKSGDSVTIRLTSDDFDAYVSLQDSSGTELASDDDSAGTLNAEIAAFSLPADATYTIIVTSARHHTSDQDVATGNYTLALLADQQPTFVTPTPTTSFDLFASATPGSSETQVGGASGGPISIGSTVTGQLTSDVPVVQYTFDATAGQVVTISLNSDEFDSYLTLNDAVGNFLTFDDDGGGGLNARIDSYAIPADGTYIIYVTSTDGTGTGSFTLSLEASQGLPHTEVFTPEPTTTEIAPTELPPTEVTPVNTGEGQPIEFGQTVTGSLDSSQTFSLYTFQGEAGDVVVITMSASGFAPYVYLTEPNLDYTLASSSSDSSATTTVLGPFTLSDSATYTVNATSYYGDGAGSYTLRVDRVSVTAVNIGDTASLTVGGDTPRQFVSFQGNPGDALDIAVDSAGSVDTQLTVLSPSGYQIASDDDSGRGFDPEILRLILTESGTYYVVISAPEGSDAGDIQLSVTESAIPSLDSGPKVVRLNDKRTQDVVTFTGTAGERVHLDFTLDSGTMEPTITVTQNGQTLSYASATGVSSLAVEIVLPADGKVVVQVQDQTSTTLNIKASLERK